MSEEDGPRKRPAGEMVDLWAMSPGVLVDEHFICSALGVSVKTLRNWRSAKTGPKFMKVGGNVRYKIAAVTEWLDQL